MFGQCEAAWQMCDTAAACLHMKFGEGRETRVVAKSKALQSLMEGFGLGQELSLSGCHC